MPPSHIHTQEPAFTSAPVDTPTLSPFPILPLARSLDYNEIGAKGATALAAILNETKITHLKCAAAPQCLLPCQRPLTRKRTPPAPPASESEHVHFPNTFLAWLCRTSLLSLTNAHTSSLPYSLIHAMLPSIVRRVDRGHVLLSDGWVARAPAPISAPCDLSATAWSTTTWTTRPSRPSETPRAAASILHSSKRPRCATPPPGVPTPGSPATPRGLCASAAHGAACVRFRCGPPRDAEGVVLQFVDHAYCHRL